MDYTLKGSDIMVSIDFLYFPYELNNVNAGDVQGLKHGQPLRCYELTAARLAGAGLNQYNACNPK